MTRYCSKDDVELLELAQGRLAVPKAIALRGHLLTCAHCRTRYRRFCAVSERLSVVGAAEGFGPPHRDRPIRWGKLFALSAVSALFLALTAVVVSERLRMLSTVPESAALAVSSGDGCSATPAPRPNGKSCRQCHAGAK